MDDIRARLTPLIGDRFELSQREDRWLAMTDEVVAFVGDAKRLAIERWLLERWRANGVPVARVLRDDGDLQIRERMHGRTGVEIHVETDASPLFEGQLPDVYARLGGTPWPTIARLDERHSSTGADARRGIAKLSSFGARVAESYGEIAVRIRDAIDIAEVAHLPLCTNRALDVDAAIASLRNADPQTAEKAAAVRDWLVAIPPPDAVIHGDLHFHNMCVDDSGTIIGVFDLGDAGRDASATEMLYVHSLGAEFAARAIAAYNDRILLEDVHRAHLRAALGHVLDHGPGTPRHASIIAWTRAAFDRLT